MHIRSVIAGALPLAFAVAMPQATLAAPVSPAGTTAAVASQPARSDSMQELQRSAQRLRQAIQALAQKKPGPERDRAIDQAHEALLETQRAMASLPPELRSTGGAATASTADYDASVTRLMKAADSLRHSIQEMAQQPAGERRNRAIEQANKALRDTQAAMVHAYQPTSGRAMGAGPAGQDSGKGKQESRSMSRPDGAVVVLLPSAMAGNAQFANGCWVRFFDDKQYRGDTLTLAGPVDMPKMQVPGGLWRDWDSAVVGPSARVTTYDNEDFRDRTAILAGNQSYPDLREKKLGWFEEVKSARVSCG